MIASDCDDPGDIHHDDGDINDPHHDDIHHDDGDIDDPPHDDIDHDDMT